MNEIQAWVMAHWVELGTGYLLFVNFLKGLRDALDKTPATDDNWFERLVSVLVKLSGYVVLGKRPDGTK